jgi:hypothetical protein
VNNKTPEHIAEQLKSSLLKIDNNEEKDILKMEKAVGICSVALVKLREYVNHSSFKNREEEIRFFKVTKPFVVGEYLYYSKLLEIKIRQALTFVIDMKKYTIKIISKKQIRKQVNLIGPYG